MAKKVRHMHANKPDLRVERTPAGFRVDLPVSEADVAAYFAEVLTNEPGLMRLVRVDRDSTHYKIACGAYRRFCDLLGKKEVPQWDRMHISSEEEKFARNIGSRYRAGSIEYRAFEQLDQAERTFMERQG